MQRVQPVLGRSADAFTVCIDTAIRLSGRLFFSFYLPVFRRKSVKIPIFDTGVIVIDNIDYMF